MKRCFLLHKWSPWTTLADGTGRWFKQCNQCGGVKISSERD